MDFLNQAKAFAKKIDTDEIAEQLEKGSKMVSDYGEKSGYLSKETADKIETDGKSYSDKLDAFGDSHSEYFANKPEDGGNAAKLVAQKQPLPQE